MPVKNRAMIGLMIGQTVLTLALVMFVFAFQARQTQAVTPSPTSWQSQVQAWIYPGNPACNASNEYSDGRVIHTLKPEYYTVTSAGALSQLTIGNRGCNAYSTANAASVKAASQEQYVTVSADHASMSSLVAQTTKRTSATTTLVDFVSSIGFTGVDLDFEGFGQWTATDYANYKLFVTQLGNALHDKGFKLQIDGPPIGNATEQSYYKWKYEDFVPLPVDYVTVMAYDYQYDYGAGSPVAPNAWVQNVVRWTKLKMGNTNRIVIGLPSYGYHGTTGSYSLKIDTYAQSTALPGFSSAARNAASGELMWTHNGVSYAAQDSASLNAKRTLIEAEGITRISVWHLGGNQWFSGKSEPAGSVTPTPTPSPTATTCSTSV